jgi:HSP20 family protein
MSRDVIRLMQALFTRGQDCGDAAWCPAADLYRTPSGWLVKFDLAGVRPEDVHVRAEGGRLTVSGSRRDCCLEEGCSYYRMEIAYSHFQRSLELPCELSRCRITTDYRAGMLHVHIITETEK